jgi:serine/threonine protein kinase
VKDTSKEFSRLPSALMLQIDRLCTRLESSWQTGAGLQSEELLTELENLSSEQQQAALAELLPLELEYRRRHGQPVAFLELQARFPAADQIWLQQLSGDDEPDTILGTVEGDNSGFALATPLHSSVTAATSPIPEQLGDYRLLGILGQGGMGTVYRAVHERMGRAVAVKVLRAEIRGNAALLQRFEREVRTAARLIHPNIVTALDARIHNGLPFLVTELVDGEDLDTQVRRDGPLPLDAVLDAISQAAAGLAYAHEQGVVHRDIKPANLLRDRRGVVRVLDMGLARLDEVPSHSSRGIEQQEIGGLTDSGLIMGTAAWMAPEQARDTRKADARADLYSLGCTLHFLITGHAPYSADSTIDMIVAHLQRPLPLLQERVSGTVIPESVQELFEMLAAKNPEDRIQTAAATIARIAMIRDAIARNSELPLSKPRTHKQQSPPTHRNQIPLLGMVGIPLIAVGLMLAVLISYSLRVQPRNLPPAENAREDATSLPPQIDSPSPTATDDSASPNPPAWAFDGTAGCLHVPAISPEAGATYTLEAIVQPREFQTSNVISWLGPDWMALYISDSGLPGTARLFNEQSVVLTASTPIPLHRWTHLAAIFESNTARLFVDGREKTQAPINFTMTATTGGLYVGGVDPNRLPQGENQRFFNGSLQSLRISRGIRYSGPFTAPTTLREDPQTIAVMRPNTEGTGLVFIDSNGLELNAIPSSSGVQQMR